MKDLDKGFISLIEKYKKAVQSNVAPYEVLPLKEAILEWLQQHPKDVNTVFEYNKRGKKAQTTPFLYALGCVPNSHYDELIEIFSKSGGADLLEPSAGVDSPLQFLFDNSAYHIHLLQLIREQKANKKSLGLQCAAIVHKLPTQFSSGIDLYDIIAYYAKHYSAGVTLTAAREARYQAFRKLVKHFGDKDIFELQSRVETIISHPVFEKLRNKHKFSSAHPENLAALLSDNGVIEYFEDEEKIMMARNIAQTLAPGENSKAAREELLKVFSGEFRKKTSGLYVDLKEIEQKPLKWPEFCARIKAVCDKAADKGQTLDVNEMIGTATKISEEMKSEEKLRESAKNAVKKQKKEVEKKQKKEKATSSRSSTSSVEQAQYKTREAVEFDRYFEEKYQKDHLKYKALLAEKSITPQQRSEIAEFYFGLFDDPGVKAHITRPYPGALLHLESGKKAKLQLDSRYEEELYEVIERLYESKQVAGGECKTCLALRRKGADFSDYLDDVMVKTMLETYASNDAPGIKVQSFVFPLRSINVGNLDLERKKARARFSGKAGMVVIALNVGPHWVVACSLYAEKAADPKISFYMDPLGEISRTELTALKKKWPELKDVSMQVQRGDGVNCGVYSCEIARAAMIFSATNWDKLLDGSMKQDDFRSGVYGSPGVEMTHEELIQKRWEYGSVRYNKLNDDQKEEKKKRDNIAKDDERFKQLKKLLQPYIINGQAAISTSERLGEGVEGRFYAFVINAQMKQKLLALFQDTILLDFVENLEQGYSELKGKDHNIALRDGQVLLVIRGGGVRRSELDIGLRSMERELDLDRIKKNLEVVSEGGVSKDICLKQWQNELFGPDGVEELASFVVAQEKSKREERYKKNMISKWLSEASQYHPLEKKLYHCFLLGEMAYRAIDPQSDVEALGERRWKIQQQLWEVMQGIKSGLEEHQSQLESLLQLQDAYGRTLLHYAVLLGDVPWIEWASKVTKKDSPCWKIRADISAVGKSSTAYLSKTSTPTFMPKEKGLTPYETAVVFQKCVTEVLKSEDSLNNPYYYTEVSRCRNQIVGVVGSFLNQTEDVLMMPHESKLHKDMPISFPALVDKQKKLVDKERKKEIAMLAQKGGKESDVVLSPLEECLIKLPMFIEKLNAVKTVEGYKRWAEANVAGNTSAHLMFLTLNVVLKFGNVKDKAEAKKCFDIFIQKVSSYKGSAEEETRQMFAPNCNGQSLLHLICEQGESFVAPLINTGSVVWEDYVSPTHKPYVFIGSGVRSLENTNEYTSPLSIAVEGADWPLIESLMSGVAEEIRKKYAGSPQEESELQKHVGKVAIIPCFFTENIPERMEMPERDFMVQLYRRYPQYFSFASFLLAMKTAMQDNRVSPAFFSAALTILPLIAPNDKWLDGPMPKKKGESGGDVLIRKFLQKYMLKQGKLVLKRIRDSEEVDQNQLSKISKDEVMAESEGESRRVKKRFSSDFKETRKSKNEYALLDMHRLFEMSGEIGITFAGSPISGEIARRVNDISQKKKYQSLLECTNEREFLGAIKVTPFENKDLFYTYYKELLHSPFLENILKHMASSTQAHVKAFSVLAELKLAFQKGGMGREFEQLKFGISPDGDVVYLPLWGEVGPVARDEISEIFNRLNPIVNINSDFIKPNFIKLSPEVLRSFISKAETQSLAVSLMRIQRLTFYRDDIPFLFSNLAESKANLIIANEVKLVNYLAQIEITNPELVVDVFYEFIARAPALGAFPERMTSIAELFLSQAALSRFARTHKGVRHLLSRCDESTPEALLQLILEPLFSTVALQQRERVIENLLAWHSDAFKELVTDVVGDIIHVVDAQQKESVPLIKASERAVGFADLRGEEIRKQKKTRAAIANDKASHVVEQFNKYADKLDELLISLKDQDKQLPQNMEALNQLKQVLTDMLVVDQQSAEKKLTKVIENLQSNLCWNALRVVLAVEQNFVKPLSPLDFRVDAAMELSQGDVFYDKFSVGKEGQLICLPGLLSLERGKGLRNKVMAEQFKQKEPRALVIELCEDGPLSQFDKQESAFKEQLYQMIATALKANREIKIYGDVAWEELKAYVTERLYQDGIIGRSAIFQWEKLSSELRPTPAIAGDDITYRDTPLDPGTSDRTLAIQRLRVAAAEINAMEAQCQAYLQANWKTDPNAFEAWIARQSADLSFAGTMDDIAKDQNLHFHMKLSDHLALPPLLQVYLQHSKPLAKDGRNQQNELLKRIIDNQNYPLARDVDMQGRNLLAWAIDKGDVATVKACLSHRSANALLQQLYQGKLLPEIAKQKKIEAEKTGVFLDNYKAIDDMFKQYEPARFLRSPSVIFPAPPALPSPSGVLVQASESGDLSEPPASPARPHTPKKGSYFERSHLQSKANDMYNVAGLTSRIMMKIEEKCHFKPDTGKEKEWKANNKMLVELLQLTLKPFDVLVLYQLADGKENILEQFVDGIASALLADLRTGKDKMLNVQQWQTLQGDALYVSHIQPRMEMLEQEGVQKGISALMSKAMSRENMLERVVFAVLSSYLLVDPNSQIQTNVAVDSKATAENNTLTPLGGGREKSSAEKDVWNRLRTTVIRQQILGQLPAEKKPTDDSDYLEKAFRRFSAQDCVATYDQALRFTFDAINEHVKTPAFQNAQEAAYDQLRSVLKTFRKLQDKTRERFPATRWRSDELLGEARRVEDGFYERFIELKKDVFRFKEICKQDGGDQLDKLQKAVPVSGKKPSTVKGYEQYLKTCYEDLLKDIKHKRNENIAADVPRVLLEAQNPEQFKQQIVSALVGIANGANAQVKGVSTYLAMEQKKTAFFDSGSEAKIKEALAALTSFHEEIEAEKLTNKPVNAEGSQSEGVLASSPSTDKLLQKNVTTLLEDTNRFLSKCKALSEAMHSGLTTKKNAFFTYQNQAADNFLKIFEDRNVDKKAKDYLFKQFFGKGKLANLEKHPEKKTQLATQLAAKFNGFDLESKKALYSDLRKKYGSILEPYLPPEYEKFESLTQLVDGVRNIYDQATKLSEMVEKYSRKNERASVDSMSSLASDASRTSQVSEAALTRAFSNVGALYNIKKAGTKAKKQELELEIEIEEASRKIQRFEIEDLQRLEGYVARAFEKDFPAVEEKKNTAWADKASRSRTSSNASAITQGSSYSEKLQWERIDMQWLEDVRMDTKKGELYLYFKEIDRDSCKVIEEGNVIREAVREGMPGEALVAYVAICRLPASQNQEAWDMLETFFIKDGEEDPAMFLRGTMTKLQEKDFPQKWKEKKGMYEIVEVKAENQDMVDELLDCVEDLIPFSEQQIEREDTVLFITEQLERNGMKWKDSGLIGGVLKYEFEAQGSEREKIRNLQAIYDELSEKIKLNKTEKRQK